MVCSSDNVTASLVVAAFLAGIGAGTLFSAKLCKGLSPKTSFRLLAVLETLITVFAFISPLLYYDLLFDFFLRNNFTLFQTFAILFLSLLPPTFLMGMSMPLLGRAIVNKAENTGSVLGGLYAANIVGASSGAFVTSFLLLGTFGMDGALYFGGILNLLIAVVLWLMPHRFQDEPDKKASIWTTSWQAWIGTMMVVLFLFTQKNLAGSAEKPVLMVFTPGTFFMEFMPGTFMIMSALSVFGFPKKINGTHIIATAMLATSLLFFDARFFLPVSAILALSLSEGDMEKWRSLLPFYLLVLAIWIPSLFGGSNQWSVFHYLVGVHWLTFTRYGKSNSSPIIDAVLRGIVPAALFSSSYAAVLGGAACSAFIILDTRRESSLNRQPSALWRKLTMAVTLALVFGGLLDLPPYLIAMAGVGAFSCLVVWDVAYRDQENLELSGKIWILLAFIAGFAAVSLEMIWFRTLYTYFRGNSYVFGPMLGVFLLSDGLGMWVASKMLKKIRSYPFAFLCSQAMIILSTSVTYLIFMDMRRLQPSAPEMMIAAMLLMGAPCFFMGFTFPFIQESIQHENEKIGLNVGVILFANTLGNAMGGLVAAFILLGYLGTVNSVLAIACISVAAIAYCALKRKSLRPVLFLGGPILFFCALLPTNTQFWQLIHGRPPQIHPSILVEDYSGVCLVTVAASEIKYYTDSSDRRRGTMFVSGYRQGDIPFGDSQTISGVLGAAFHPEPKEVLCIGVGSAATPFLMGIRRDITRIDMVELAEAEIPALKESIRQGFGRFLKPVFEDPRYRLHIADGRAVLFNSGLYDIIQADMRTAQSAGSGAIYSREFYSHASKHLKPGGYFVQQLFGTHTLATMRSVFPHVYQIGFFALGSNDPIPVSSEILFRYMEEELVPGLLRANLNPERVRQIIRKHVSDVEFKQWPPLGDHESPGSVNTDLFPLDEFYMNEPFDFKSGFIGRFTSDKPR